MFTTASASRGLRASWFVFVVPMAIGALLLLGIASAQAQQGRPDFQVIKATFDGRNLHVEYVNATGVGYPRVRYEVGFQWYDSTGKPVGERHWLPVPEVERGGVAILDTKYRIDLTYRRSGSNYNRRLLDFILQRPNTAEELRVTVDDGDRVSETNESNNVASLRIPLPDLWITGAKFLSPNQLELSYRNLNPSPIPLPFRIGFTWAMESGTHLTPTRWINVVEPRDGATETVVLSRTDASYITTQNRQAGDRLDWYFERRPGNATRLQVTMDDAGTVREQNELNNMVSVRPFLPDLVVRDAKLANGQLTFTYGNDGDGYIRDIASRVAFQWVNAAGKPIGDPRWSGFAQMNPKQAFTMNADRFDVQYVVPGTNRTTTQRLSTYLGTRPEGATQFRVTIDDEQKLLEADEGNNVVTIAVVPSVAEPDPIVKPFPDLAITSFALGEEATGDILRIRFKNLGGSTALTRSGDSLIPFWLVWTHANGQSVAGASSYWFDLRREPLLAGMEGATTVTLANGAILVPHGAGRGAGRTITQFFADPPTGATHLQAIIDGPNRIEESNETNNTAIIERPAPDLTIEKVEATTDALTIRYRNRGAINAVDRSGRGVTTFWLTWTDADGKAIADAKRYGVDTRSNALLQPGEERTLTLQEALGAIIVPHGSDLKSGLTLAQFFAEAPEHATHLQVVIDGPNTYAEANEQNNAALLKFLKPVQPKPEAPIVVPNEVPKPEEPPPPPPRQPDLTITDATLDTAALRFWMRNLGEGPATPVVSIWYEWVDEKGERVGELRWINVGGMSPKSKQQGNQLLDFADLDGERGKIFLGAFVANAPASAAHLKLSIDGPNAHAESNEQNNSVFLPKPKLADLRIAEFTMDPIAPRAGDRVWFTARVENVGNATTGQPTATGIIVDNDATSRKLVGQFTTAIVPAGKSVMVRWTKENYYGWVAVEGAHTIDVCADRAKVVGEADETNNCARKTVTVRAPEDETPKLPDLLVESAAVELGALRIAARNDGGTVSDATDIWLMWFGTKGALSSSAAVNLPAVAAGGTTIVVVEVPLDGNTEASRILRDPPKDATKLRVYADGSRKVKEVHEDNNDAYLDRAKFPTAPIENKPPTADAGEDITARDDDGDGKEDVRFYSRESKDPDGKIAKWTWTVAGREVATGQYPYWWKVPVGTHTVTLTVTDDKGATATDTVTVTVGAKPSTQPDLAFEAFTMTPTQPKPGDTVSFTARVANRSTISIGAVSTVSFDIWTDGKYRTQLAQPVVRDLAPGESQEFHWNDPNDRYYHWKPQAGSHRIIVCVDNTKLIAEADEKNNCAEVVVTVGVATPEPPSKPDLVPEALRVSPANARVGQMLTFSATVRNRGGSPASESVAWFLVDFDRDGETDLTSEPEEVPALAAGATKTVTWPQAIAAEPGSHTLEFCVDADEEVAEADEKNNCTKFPFTVSSTGTAPESSSLGSSFFSSLLGALFGATPIVAGGPEDVRR